MEIPSDRNTCTNGEERHMNWIETPLSHFGFKCIAGKHDDCEHDKCECLCHGRNHG